MMELLRFKTWSTDALCDLGRRVAALEAAIQRHDDAVMSTAWAAWYQRGKNAEPVVAESPLQPRASKMTDQPQRQRVRVVLRSGPVPFFYGEMGFRNNQGAMIHNVVENLTDPYLPNTDVWVPADTIAFIEFYHPSEQPK